MAIVPTIISPIGARSGYGSRVESLLRPRCIIRLISGRSMILDQCCAQWALDATAETLDRPEPVSELVTRLLVEIFDRFEVTAGRNDGSDLQAAVNR